MQYYSNLAYYVATTCDLFCRIIITRALCLSDLFGNVCTYIAASHIIQAYKKCASDILWGYWKALDYSWICKNIGVYEFLIRYSFSSICFGLQICPILYSRDWCAGVRKKFLNTAYKNSFHRSTWCQTLNYCYLSAHYLFIYMCTTSNGLCTQNWIFGFGYC